MFCVVGHYCEFATVNPVDCAAGTYMPYGVDQATLGTTYTLIGPGKIINSVCVHKA